MLLPDDYPPILADIAQLLGLRLAQHLPAEQAATLARALTDDLSLTYSGCQIYIPKQDAQRRAQRDAALARAFDGHNHAALARRYGLTVTQVYEILARQRQTRQPALSFE